MKACAYGAFVGAAIAYFDIERGADVSFQIGQLIGGVIAGGVIFGLVATVRNWMVGAR